MHNRSFVELLGRWGQSFPSSMTYDGEEDFSRWKRRFRAKLDELRGPVPERAEPRVEVLEEVEEETHTRVRLEIAVNEFSDLPALLLIPKGIHEGAKRPGAVGTTTLSARPGAVGTTTLSARPGAVGTTTLSARPGLVALHGHAQFGMETVAGIPNAEVEEHPHRAYGRAAVDSGFAVLVPGWWGWPGRNGHLGLVGSRDKCNVIQMAAGMYGINVLSLHIEDACAAVDVLAARPEVDASRIGCLGNSYGGRTAMWLAIYDERVRACVSSGAANLFRERSLKLSSCGIQYFFGLLQYGDVAELYSLIAPRALQLLVGEKDPLITPSDRDAIAAAVREAYARAGAQEMFQYKLHPGGHALHWEDAEPFLRQHLIETHEGE